MSVDFSEVGALLTRGNDPANQPSVWRIVAYCQSPTVIVKNLETGEEKHFGTGGLTAQGWMRLVPHSGDLG